eukprot:3110373-Rhodomonas_salina.2
MPAGARRGALPDSERCQPQAQAEWVWPQRPVGPVASCRCALPQCGADSDDARGDGPTLTWAAKIVSACKEDLRAQVEGGLRVEPLN